MKIAAKIAIICLAVLLPIPTFAVNQASNYDLSQAGTYWTANNTVNWQTCLTNSTTTATAWTSLQRNSTAVTSWAATSTTGSAASYGGYAWQTFTVPGSGTQNVTGRIDWSSITSSGIGASWVREDVYDVDGTFRGNLSCATFSSSAATSTQTGPAIKLTGGTTYRLSITAHGVTTSGGSGKFVDIFMTKIYANPSPVGVTISTVKNTTPSISLGWTASVATTTAAALAAANGYNIYRGTATRAETGLASSTAVTYTDSAVTGNTTYFYWLTDADTNSIESATSTEVSVLTVPGVPTIPVLSGITASNITVNATAPAGGAASYTVNRCYGLTCTPIAPLVSGVALPYNDTSVSALAPYTYSVTATNATGNSATSTTVSSNAGAQTINGMVTLTGGTFLINGTTIIIR